jgi:hypothetical protein
MKQESTPERIAALAHELEQTLRGSIGQIGELNDRTHVLAINARIEAARAGLSGRGFKVVADAFGALNIEIQSVSVKLTEESQKRLDELLSISSELAGTVQGERLTQIAGSVMDVVDRNLYERSCDVRWWATEAAVVEVLDDPSRADAAVDRLATILKSYTVYYDIVVVDRSGRVVANGQPDRFAVQGLDVSDQPWFRQALERGADEFGFQSVHRGALAGGSPVLVYSCSVRSRGAVTGVLGVVFRWEGLGATTLAHAAETLDEAEFVLVEPDGTVLAAHGTGSEEPLSWNGSAELLAGEASGFRIVSGGRHLLARGLSPGFETYATGWSCLIRQKFHGESVRNGNHL